MNIDVIDMLTISASQYIQEAEKTENVAWAQSLYRLADRYIGELSRIARTHPISMDVVGSVRNEGVPGGGFWD